MKSKYCTGVLNNTFVSVLPSGKSNALSGSLGFGLPRTARVLVASYIFLYPFYFWESGLPQLSDLVRLLLLGWLAINSFSQEPQKSLKIKSSGSIAFSCPMALFVYYVLLVNLAWALVSTHKLSFILSTMYMLFNFLTLVAFYSLYSKYGKSFLQTLYWWFTLTLWTQVIISVLPLNFESARPTLFFNNPNQLGYYALLTAAVLFVSKSAIEGRYLVHYFSLLGCLYIAVLSLSRAGMLSTAFLFSCALVLELSEGKVRFRIRVGRILIIGIIAGAFIYFFRDFFTTVLQSWESRVESKGLVGSDSVADRGYQRITDNSQYLLFGAGEGDYQRFSGAMELHSIPGNIFFSYGLIGLSLFLITLIVIMRNNPISIIPYTSIMLYGISHNGIRSGHLWLLFAITAFSIVAQNKKQSLFTERIRSDK